MKTKEKSEVRRLRSEEGRSVKEIAKLVGVSSSSVSLWVRDIKLTKIQIERLNSRVGRRLIGHSNRDYFLSLRSKYQQEGRELSKIDNDFQNLCMLYWGEGFKDRNSLAFANTDQSMLKYYISLVRKCLMVDNDKFRIVVHRHSDTPMTEKEINGYWSKLLDLPLSCFTKGRVKDNAKWGGRKINKHPYGICRISVHDTRLVQMVYGGIQQISKSDNENWVK